MNTIFDLPKNEAPAPPVDIFKKAICLKLDMGMLGSSKKLAGDQFEVDADKDRVSASKNILACKELENIRSAQSALGKRIKAQCLPSMFKAGVYLLPIASISTVDKMLTEGQAEIINELVPAFLAIYPDLIERDKISLRGTFDPGDYMPIAKARASFYCVWEYVQFGVPDALQNVDADIFKREQEKAAARLTEAAATIESVLRNETLKLVTHLSDKLAGLKDGKTKRFYDSSIDNVKDFLSTFRNRNITDDKQLDELCARAEQLLAGVDPDAIRNSDVVRDRVQAGFAEIATKLDGMMQNKPTRAILDDEAAA